MLGRIDLYDLECTDCKGTGRDPKKRTRPCPRCRGAGVVQACHSCGGVYGESCVDEVMDQSRCSKGGLT